MNKIINENAKKAFADAEAEATKTGRAFSLYQVAKEMAEELGLPPDDDGVRKFLERRLRKPMKRPTWNPPHITAFEHALKIDEGALKLPIGEEQRVHSATFIARRWASIGRRLAARDENRAVDIFEHLLGSRHGLDLALDLAQAVVENRVRKDLADRLNEIVYQSKRYTPKPAPQKASRKFQPT